MLTFYDHVVAIAAGVNVDIVVIAANQAVVACTADQRVIAALAIECIVAGKAADLIPRVEAINHVVAGRRGLRQPQEAQVTAHPGGAVIEDDLVDAPVVPFVEVALQYDRAIVARPGCRFGYDQNCIVAIALKGDLARRDALQHNPVRRAARSGGKAVLLFDNDIVAITADIEIGVVVITAAKAIVAEPAGDGIVSAAAVDGVVAGQTIDRVGRLEGYDAVVTCRRLGQHDGQVEVTPDRPVVELEVLDTTEPVPELIEDAQAVVGTSYGDKQVVALPFQSEIGGRYTGPENHPVVRSGKDAGDQVTNLVLSVAEIEDISVAAVVADQGVVAGAAIKSVGAVEAVDHVIAGRAFQRDKLDIVSVPDSTIGKGKRLDLEVPVAEVVPEELVFDPQAVARAHQVDNQVVALSGENQICRRNFVGEGHLIALLGKNRSSVVEDHVAAVSGAENVDVAAVLAQQPIVAGAAVKDVDAEEANQGVVACRRALIDQLVLQVAAIPDGAVGEVNLFHFVEAAAEVVCSELVKDGELVSGRRQR